MKEDKGFSRREWLFVIFIIILTQFLVQFVAFIYAGNSSALGYISVSGTIVSIILALLAIIYSYYQSTSQSNSSSSLNSQIEKLIGIVDKIKTDKSDFGHELEQLAEIREKIDSSFSLQKVSHAQVRALSDTIDDLRDNRLSESYKNKSEDNSFNRLVVDGDNLIHLTLILIHYASSIGVEVKNMWSELSEPTVQALHDNNASPELLEFYKGSISSIITVFKALGFIEITDENFPITPEDDFEEQLSSFRDFIASRDDADYKEMIKTLDELTK
ncbi:hypothetical protein [Stutzerimonas nitrititolerans]|uniref:hypothetical protein n=1 Tax=Stutzerimonas nitrititolerans TaxID=2482751 RepID=UPI0028A64537|nr:hypothetical protein [Stutzerimonas nitrititolerans]